MILYFTIWGAVTGSINDNFSSAWDGVTCPMPDYENGYDEECSLFSHPDSYADDMFVLWNATGAWYSGGGDWVAGIPTGPFVYAGHWLAAGLQKGGFVLASIVALFIAPELTMYGQTVNASEIAWLNGPLFAFAIFFVINLGKGWL